MGSDGRIFRALSFIQTNYMCEIFVLVVEVWFIRWFNIFVFLLWPVIMWHWAWILVSKFIHSFMNQFIQKTNHLICVSSQLLSIHSTFPKPDTITKKWPPVRRIFLFLLEGHALHGGDIDSPATSIPYSRICDALPLQRWFWNGENEALLVIPPKQYTWGWLLAQSHGTRSCWNPFVQKRATNREADGEQVGKKMI